MTVKFVCDIGSSNIHNVYQKDQRGTRTTRSGDYSDVSVSTPKIGLTTCYLTHQKLRATRVNYTHEQRTICLTTNCYNRTL